MSAIACAYHQYRASAVIRCNERVCFQRRHHCGPNETRFGESARRLSSPATSIIWPSLRLSILVPSQAKHRFRTATRPTKLKKAAYTQDPDFACTYLHATHQWNQLRKCILSHPIKSGIAWLAYRDAWVNLGATRYPTVSAAIWGTFATCQRIKMPGIFLSVSIFIAADCPCAKHPEEARRLPSTDPVTTAP